jgi:hypothetical protein
LPLPLEVVRNGDQYEASNVCNTTVKYPFIQLLTTLRLWSAVFLGFILEADLVFTKSKH